MLIAALDSDSQFTKRLNRLLKGLLINVDYVAFHSPSECLKYTMEHDVSLMFINQSIGNHFSDMQLLHYKLRKIRPHLDTLIVYNENKWDSSVALWTIQNRCSDYISKSVTEERLQDALKNIWFHPIAEVNFLKSASYYE